MKFMFPLGIAVLLFLAQGAQASPADYVYTPEIDAGEGEIDLKMGSADTDPRFSVATLGWGYGVTPWWFTEAYAKGSDSGDGFDYDAIEWENRFRLMPQLSQAVDLGFVIELEFPRDRDAGIEIKAGPLLQWEQNQWQFNGNVLFEKVVDTPQTNPTLMLYQLQARRHSAAAVDLGMQVFGEWGEWNHWASGRDQFHNLGPAVFGKIQLGSELKVAYNLAWLFGITDGTPDNTLRAQIELEL